jgi:hypothetical protein
MAAQEVYILLFAAVLLVIVLVAVLLYALQRLRRRRAQLLSDLKASPRLNSDRAFNRLVMARKEAEILTRQGSDITRARELIAQAQSAFDLGQFERSYELAQSAHEALVAARQGRALPTGAPSTSEPLTSRAGPGARPVERLGAGVTTYPTPTGVPLAAATGLPRNRVESQFAMKLLDAEVATAKNTRPTDPATLSALEFQGKAQAAFAAGEYTDAFRFALKGRRGLGSNVETVAPGPGTRPGVGGGVPLDAGPVAERAVSATRCPDCGYPTTADDVFCRGCGSQRSPATCPRCGTPRTTVDTFCGRCGERFS